MLSVKVPDPSSPQTKDKLVSLKCDRSSKACVNEALATWFEEHPTEAKVIVGKVASRRPPPAKPPARPAR